MKRFLCFVGLVYSIYFIITVGVRVFLFSVFPGALKQNAIDLRGVTTIVMGPSNGQYSWNDTIIKQSKNLCTPGTSNMVTYSQLRYIFEHCDTESIDTVVLGASCFSFLQLDDNLMVNQVQLSSLRGFEEFACVDPKDFLSVYASLPIYWEMIFTTRPSVYWMNRYPHMDGYREKDGCKIMEKGAIDDYEENMSKINGYDGLTEEWLRNNSSLQCKYLILIYEYCKQRGIQLVLLNTPIYRYPDAISDRGYKDLLRHSLGLDVLVADYSKFPIPNEGFYDYSHLNSYGAGLFSHEIAAKGLKCQTLEDYCSY